MAKRSSITSYIKNLGKSLGYATYDAVGDYTPVTKGIIEATKTTFQEAKASMKDIAKSGTEKGKSFTSDVLSNTLEDLKSGNWYNKKRMDSDMFGDFDFDDDFGDIEDWGDEDFGDSDSDSADVITANDDSNTRKVISSIGKVSGNLSKSIGYASARNAEYIVAHTRASNAALYNLNAKGFNQVSNILLNMDNTMAGIAKLGQPLGNFMENSFMFYTNTTNSLNKINESLDKLVERTAMLDPKAKKDRSVKGSYSSIFGGGAFDASAYADMVKDNIKEISEMAKGIGSMIGMMSGGGLGGKNTLSLTSMILKGGLQLMMPGMTKESLRQFDKALSNAIGRGLRQMSRNSSGNMLIDALNSIFGVKDEFKTSVKTGNYEKGPMPWDGVARKALVEVIPTYLAKLNAILGGDEKYYDYEAGKFVTVHEIRKKKEEMINNAALAAGGDFRYDMMKSVRGNKEMESQFENFFRTAFLNGKDFDLGKLSADNIAEIFGISKQAATKLKTAYNTGGYTDKGFSKKKNDYHSFLNDIHVNRADLNDRFANMAGEDNVIIRLDDGSIVTVPSKSGSGTAADKLAAKYNTNLGVSLGVVLPEYLKAIHAKLNRGKTFEYNYETGKFTPISYGNNSRGGSSSTGTSVSDTSVDVTGTEAGSVKENEDGTIEVTLGEYTATLDKTQYNNFIALTTEEQKIAYIKKAARDNSIKNMKNAALEKAKATSFGGKVKNLFGKVRSIGDFPGAVGSMAINSITNWLNSLFMGDSQSGKKGIFKNIGDFFGNLTNNGYTSNKRQSVYARALGKAIAGLPADTIDVIREPLAGGGYVYYAITGDGEKHSVDNAAAEKFYEKHGLLIRKKRAAEAIARGDLPPGTEDIIREVTDDDKEIWTAIRYNGKSVEKLGTVSADVAEKFFGRKKGFWQATKEAFRAIGGKIKTSLFGEGKFSDNVRDYMNNAKAEMEGSGSGLRRFAGGDSGVEEKQDAKAKGKGAVTKAIGDIGNTAAAGFKKLLMSLTAGAETDKEKVFDGIKKGLSKIGDAKGAIGAGAIIGTGVSLLTGAVVGPLGGAAIGAAAGLVAKSTALQDVLFGKGDPDSEEYQEGILGALGASIKKDKKGLIGGAIGAGVGAITTQFVMGSPVVGAIVGAAGGYVARSEVAQKFLFGENNEKALGQLKEKLKKKYPSILVGAAAGALVGPFGMAGNLIVGAGMGYLTTTERFQHFMFGDPENPDSKYGKYGLMGKVNDIVHNLSNAIEGFARRLGTRINDFFKKIGTSIRDRINKGLTQYAEEKKEQRGFGGFMGRLASGLATIGENGILGPATLLQGGLRRHNLRKGNAVYDRELGRNMTALERVTYAQNNKIGGRGVYGAVDEYLATLNDEQFNELAGMSGEDVRARLASNGINVSKNTQLSQIRALISGENKTRKKNAAALKEAQLNDPNYANILDIKKMLEKKFSSTTEYTPFGIVQLGKNGQGEPTEQINDKETAETLKRRNTFLESLAGLGPLGEKLSGGLDKLKKKLFGEEDENGEKQKGLFDKIKEWFNLDDESSWIMMFLSKAKAMLKNIIPGAIAGVIGFGALGGLFDKIADKLSGGKVADHSTTTAYDANGNPVTLGTDGKYYDASGNQVSANDLTFSTAGSNDKLSNQLWTNMGSRALMGGGLNSVGGSFLKLGLNGVGRAFAGKEGAKLGTNLGKQIAKEGFTGALANNADDIAFTVSVTLKSLIDTKLVPALRKCPGIKNFIIKAEEAAAKETTSGTIGSFLATKIMKTTKAGTGALKSFMSKVSNAVAVLKIIYIIARFQDAFDNAENVMGISETATPSQRLIAGIIGAINAVIPYIGELLTDSQIVDIGLWFARLIGIDTSDIDEKREAAKELAAEAGYDSVQAYNRANGISTGGFFTTYGERATAFGAKVKAVKEENGGGFVGTMKGIGSAIGMTAKAFANTMKEDYENAGGGFNGIMESIAGTCRTLIPGTLGEGLQINTRILKLAAQGDIKGIWEQELSKAKLSTSLETDGFESIIAGIIWAFGQIPILPTKIVATIPALFVKFGKFLWEKITPVVETISGFIHTGADNFKDKFAIAMSGDILGLWKDNMEDEEGNPLGGVYKGLNFIQNLILTPPALFKKMGNAIAERFTKIIDGAKNLGTAMVEAEKSGEEILKSGGTFREFLDISKIVNDEDGTPLGGIGKSLIMGQRIMSFPMLAIKKIGKQMADNFTLGVKIIKASATNLTQDYLVMNEKMKQGDVQGLWDTNTGANDNPDNPLNGVFKVVNFLQKMQLTVPALFSKMGHKIAENFKLVAAATKMNITNLFQDYVSMQGSVQAGDVDALWATDTTSNDEGNPFHGFLKATNFIQKLLLTPGAFFTKVGKSIAGYVTTAVGIAKSSVTNLFQDYVSMHSLATQGEVGAIWETDTTGNDEGNPMWGLLKGVNFVQKLLLTPVGIFSKIGITIKDKFTSMAENIKSDADNLKTSVAALMDMAETSDSFGSITDIIKNDGFVPQSKVAGPLFYGIYNISKLFSATIGAFNILGNQVQKAIDKAKSFFGGIFNAGVDAIDEKDKTTGESFWDKISGWARGGRSAIAGGDSGFVSQFDPRYQQYNIAGQSFGAKGCGPAVAAMASSAMGRPMSVSQAMRYSNGYQTPDGVTLDYFQNALGSQGINTEVITGGSSQDMYNRIASGQKMVLLGRDPYNTSKRNSPFGPNNHYVLATGVDSRGNVIINDPEGRAPRAYNPNILRSASFGVAGGGSKARRPRRTIKNLRNKFRLIAGGASYDTDIAQAVWSFFRNRGYSEAATAGIMGNLHAESGMDPTRLQNGHHYAAGIAQWERYDKQSGRWKNLYDYAASKGRDWTDLETQLEWIDRECQDSRTVFWTSQNAMSKAGVNATTFDGFKQSTNVEQATREFEGAFERAGTPRFDARIEAAKTYFQLYTGKTTSDAALSTYAATAGTAALASSSSSSSGSSRKWTIGSLVSNVAGVFSDVFGNFFNPKSETATTTDTSSSSSGAIGSTSGSISGSVVNNFPYFHQGDNPWGPKTYGTHAGASNYKSAGCAPTTAAMIMNSYGASIGSDPESAGNYAIQAGDRRANNGTYATLFPHLAQANGLKATSISGAQVVDYLKKGIPVAALMGKGDFTSGGHYIALTGYENGGILVNDPNSRDKSGKLWNPSIVNQGKAFYAISDANGVGSIGKLQNDLTTNKSYNVQSHGSVVNTKQVNGEWCYVYSDGYTEPISKANKNSTSTTKKSGGITGAIGNAVAIGNRVVTAQGSGLMSYGDMSRLAAGSSGLLLRSRVGSRNNVSGRRLTPHSFAGGASSIAEATTSILNNARTSVANAANAGTISPELVAQLLSSITALLESIANNTAPVAQIYTALRAYMQAGGGSHKEESSKVTAMDNHPSGASQTDDTVDANIQSLVGVLAQLAKG